MVGMQILQPQGNNESVHVVWLDYTLGNWLVLTICKLKQIRILISSDQMLYYWGKQIIPY